MDKVQLQQLLGTLAPLEDPQPALEQYGTPPQIAADMLHLTDVHVSLENKTVLDLGTGNGILAIGAALLGANSTGIDIDPGAIETARENTDRVREQTGKDLATTFAVEDVVDCNRTADIVVMNPPFGIQQQGSNTVFLSAAFRCAPLTFTLLHLSREKREETMHFYEKYAERHGKAADPLKEYRFQLPKTQAFHTQAETRIPVALYRFA